LSNDNILGGEEVVHSSFALIEVDQRWAAGFLYLTNFRLLWMPGDFFFSRGSGLPSHSIRLNRIETWQITRRLLSAPRLRIKAHSQDIQFRFVGYFTSLIGTGDARAHMKWKRVLGTALQTRAD
jgi:hypothetical protein